ncbi:MAG: hypothetical protein IKU52_00460 [Clostridia bacterium]|nr:hypothetical protein [Clostridia bacterium]
MGFSSFGDFQTTIFIIQFSFYLLSRYTIPAAIIIVASTVTSMEQGRKYVTNTPAPKARTVYPAILHSDLTEQRITKTFR